MGEINHEEDEPYDSSFEEDDAMSFVMSCQNGVSESKWNRYLGQLSHQERPTK